MTPDPTTHTLLAVCLKFEQAAEIPEMTAAFLEAGAMREITDIEGFHAHVYFDAATRAAAEALREDLAQRFTVELGRVHDHPVGPHSQAMYQVAFTPEEFPKIVPWLMLNRRGLSILVHPRTGDDVADHDTNPLWLGAQLPVDLEFLRHHSRPVV